MLQKLYAPLVLLAAAIAAPAVATAATTPTDGLLVTQVNSEQWQVRLVSKTAPQQFAGSIASTGGFTTVSASMVERTDRAQLTSDNSLALSLQAWPGGADVVTFTVAPTAKLCLRTDTGSKAPVYLGASLAEAVRVTAPAALQGADACSTATVESTPTGTDATTATTTRKYHRGHYIALLRGQSSQKLMAASMKPGVRGFLKRYTWRELEPTLGNYDFAEIQSDLAWAAANKVQLIVMIEDKTFVVERPTPAYLDSYTPRNRAGGYTVVRWDPYVVARMKALVTAIGNRFDTNAAFEGIATQETAPGFDSTLLKSTGYTPEKYRDAYIAILSTAATAMPTSRVFWYMNFFPGNQAYIGTIANAVASKGVVMGGPDVWPDSKSLQSKTYPFYHDMYGKMSLFGQVEPVCYSLPHMTSGYSTKYWTMAELFKYARDNLKVNYMFWVRLPTASPTDAYEWTDALPVISTNAAFN